MTTLVYADADGIERYFTLGAEPVLVGRAEQCGIRSSDPRVSRTHARFYLDPVGTLYVEDLGSSNGVYIGPHRVQYGVVPLGEVVLVGSLTFRLHAQGGQLQPQGLSPTPPGSVLQDTSPALRPADPMQPSPELVANLEQQLEAERKARIATEEERNAYGARMAELHGELRTLKESQAQVRAELASRVEELTVTRNDLIKAEDRILDLSRKVAELEQRLGTR